MCMCIRICMFIVVCICISVCVYVYVYVYIQPHTLNKGIESLLTQAPVTEDVDRQHRLRCDSQALQGRQDRQSAGVAVSPHDTNRKAVFDSS